MELKVANREKNYLELEILGEEHSFPNALVEILLKEKDVEFAAVEVDHPQLLVPRLIVRTKGKDPFELLKKAAQELAKEAKAFTKEIEEKM